MPYSTIENMYKSLTLEKQEELYDYLCFLVSKKSNLKENNSEESQKNFFSLFGSINDPTFKDSEDLPIFDKEDEQF